MPNSTARPQPRTLSERIGHSDVAFMMKQYVHDDPRTDRWVADTLAELIISGLVAQMPAVVSPTSSISPENRRQLANVQVWSLWAIRVRRPAMAVPSVTYDPAIPQDTPICPVNRFSSLFERRRPASLNEGR